MAQPLPPFATTILPGLRRLIAVAFALALLATACGSDSVDTTAPDTATAVEATEAAPADEPEQAADDSAPNTDNDSTEAADSAPVEEAEPEPIDEPETSEEATDEATDDATIVDLFFDGALANDVVIVDCTLSGGAETSCYQITVVGFPVDTGVGSFCPTTTSATADEVGIWLDGENVYDIDGQFILDLPEIYGDDNWLLHDEDGHVHVTDTQEAFEAAARPDVAEEYQNHCVEGQIAWLENGEPITSTVEIPVTPVASDSVTAAGQSLGVTLNGVTIAGQAPVDAILGAYTIAAFDDCGGHINPFDGYHLHGATGCSEVGEAAAGETPVFAIALDGYPVHSPLSDADAAAADLDACNGHSTDELGYHYHANTAADNAVLTCFVGQTTAAEAAGGGGGRPPRD